MLTEDEKKLVAHTKFVYRLLNPDDLGLAVSAEVRDLARELLGFEKVENG